MSIYGGSSYLDDIVAEIENFVEEVENCRALVQVKISVTRYS
jgi:hypothetical protein